MKAVLLFVCLSVLLGTVAAQCSAMVMEDENYWTPERMMSAIPRDYILNGTDIVRAWESTIGAPEACSGTWRRHTTTNTYTAFPFNSVGRIFFTMSGSNYVCSGSIGNDRTVWTAGHCLYDEVNKRFATNFIFVPGYYNGVEPYGRYTARSLCTTSQWQRGDFAYDYALARFASNLPSNGHLTLAYNLDPTKVIYTSYGYPAGSPFNGAWENTCLSDLCGRDPNSRPNPVSISCDSTGGSSGGPWITDSNRISSLNSYGYSNQKNVMYGPYFDAATLTFWNTNRG